MSMPNAHSHMNPVQSSPLQSRYNNAEELRNFSRQPNPMLLGKLGERSSPPAANVRAASSASLYNSRNDANPLRNSTSPLSSGYESQDRNSLYNPGRSGKVLQEKFAYADRGKLNETAITKPATSIETSYMQKSPYVNQQARVNLSKEHSREYSRLSDGQRTSPNDVQAASGESMVYKTSPRQPLSVFNYEGGDKAASRNHLHMLVNHNLMTAHDNRQDEDLAKKKKNLKKSKRKITVNLQGTKYDIVKEVVENMGYTVTRDDDSTAYLIWNDTVVANERIADMKSFQRVNHFPGMGEICRKDCLARNMSKMARFHADEYNFVPKTWILPQEYNALQNYSKDLRKKKKIKIFISKPSYGSMGNGITLYHNTEKIPQTDSIVVQEYIDRPLLVDGFKCDLRIYVLISSCDPLKLFLFNDGLVRISTEPYSEPSPQNLDVLFMHLTNYSINKHSEGYEKGKSVDSGSKRSLKFLNSYLRHCGSDVAALWSNITDVIVKTMICSLPHVHHAYKMCRSGQTPNSDSVCFEILGFDIMLDRRLKPWLIEVNRSPSFGTNEQIDYDIKSAVLTDALRLVNIRASDKKKNIAAQKAATQKRLLQPRSTANEGDEKKRQGPDRRKEELKDLLAKIRKENARLEFEDRNCGNFKRIFPPTDRFHQEKYAKLLYSAFNNLVIGAGRNGSVAKEIEQQYLRKYQEDDILDMLAQYEGEETAADGRVKRSRGPPPLMAMPCSNTENAAQHDDSDDESDSDDVEERPQRSRLSNTRPKSSKPSLSRSGSARRPISRPKSGVQPQQRRNLSPAKFDNSNIHTYLVEDAAAVNKAIKEKEEELTQIVLTSLTNMRIKFPGKSDEEAEVILDKLKENWMFHKPRVASYWLVKLDSVKRRKVVDIVRSNVKAKVQHIYQTHEVEVLRIFRIFSRVFNRLLWSHGQGLWNCFAGNSWETIFSKSTDVISKSEMECCRRITQLCKDCLLIVYQFASSAKNQQKSENNVQRQEMADDNNMSPNDTSGMALQGKSCPNSTTYQYPRVYSSATPYRLNS